MSQRNVADVAEVCGIAISRLKLTPKQYYKLTPREFYNALKDNEEQKEIQSRPHLIAARKICATVWNAAGNKLRVPIRNLEEFMPLPWERRARAEKRQTADEMKDILMGIANAQNKKVNKKNKD